jgi:flagellar motor protein MotB
MVTLLLTFFVLLLTLAEVQDPELFRRGRDSFWESIRLCGLGALLGSDIALELGDDMPKYPTTEPETTEDRTIDAYRERLRRIFDRINESATTLPSQLVGQQLHFSVTSTQFAPGQAALDEPSKQALSRFCLDLRQNLDADRSTLYVLGLSGEEATEAQQWTLSARRAEAVARFLQKTLGKHVGDGASPTTEADAPAWRVFWWGAGPGGNWAGQDCPDPGQAQILIAVLKSDA